MISSIPRKTIQPLNEKKRLVNPEQPQQFTTKTGQVIHLQGCKMKPSYDSSILEGFPELFKNAWVRSWEPIYRKDLQLTKDVNVLRNIVNRVKNHNESYDICITGDRGSGKSALAVGLALQLHHLFTNGKSVFPIEQVCFNVDEFVSICSSLKGGGIVILDEVGVEGSMGSRTSMSKENRAMSDVVQLMRTDRIITIFISVDRDRIDKRVRQMGSILASPIRKLSNLETQGHGLAIMADIKLRYLRPASQNESGWRSENEAGYLVHEVSHLHYSRKGLLYSVIIPHASPDLWDAYSKKRDSKLEAIRTNAFLVYDAEQQADVTIAKAKKGESNIKPQSSPTSTPELLKSVENNVIAKARKRKSEAEQVSE